MKYAHLAERIPKEQRKALNDKILYLIDSGTAAEYGITAEDIYNAYTGDGGLHGLEQKDFDNYHKYSEAKKEVENGQFFTPAKICEYIMKSLKLSAGDTVADLTCGMGGFFNFAPTEDNVYGCELDIKAFKVAKFLYPDAHIECKDIRNYNPGTRFDYVVGNPPFNLKWKTEGEEIESQFYYCLKAAELLKPLGIMAIIVPMSFLMDDFLDKKKIKLMESHFSFLGQVELPDSAFSQLGVTRFGTKVQFWQKHCDAPGWKPNKYQPGCDITLSSQFDMDTAIRHTYEKLLMLPKANLEKNSSHVLLELARKHSSSKNFQYEVQKRLYQIKVHPATRDKYGRCCEYVYTFYTQQKPDDCTQEEWDKKKLTERKVLTYLRKALSQQNRKPEQDKLQLVHKDGKFVYKAYSAAISTSVKMKLNKIKLKSEDHEYRVQILLKHCAIWRNCRVFLEFYITLSFSCRKNDTVLQSLLFFDKRFWKTVSKKYRVQKAAQLFAPEFYQEVSYLVFVSPKEGASQKG